MKVWAQFFVSAAIWLFAFLPVVFVGFVAVALMLALGLDMTRGPWGNYKYPIAAVDAHKSTDGEDGFLSRWVFYAVRNPASNYGHFTLGNSQPWRWEYTDFRIGFLTFNFGWKQAGTFKFRPRFVK